MNHNMMDYYEYEKLMDVKGQKSDIFLRGTSVDNNKLSLDKRMFQDNSTTINLTINASFGKDATPEQFKSFSQSLIDALSKVLPINKDVKKSMKERFSEDSEVIQEFNNV